VSDRELLSQLPVVKEESYFLPRSAGHRKTRENLRPCDRRLRCPPRGAGSATTTLFVNSPAWVFGAPRGFDGADDSRFVLAGGAGHGYFDGRGRPFRSSAGSNPAARARRKARPGVKSRDQSFPDFCFYLIGS
jgi:hypothetical protein